MCFSLPLLCSSLVDELKEAVYPVLRILLQHICAKVCQALLLLELENSCGYTGVSLIV